MSRDCVLVLSTAHNRPSKAEVFPALHRLGPLLQGAVAVGRAKADRPLLQGSQPTAGGGSAAPSAKHAGS
eukprot:10594449-Alexandrium_andersonii.AAC.1